MFLIFKVTFFFTLKFLIYNSGFFQTKFFHFVSFIVHKYQQQDWEENKYNCPKLGEDSTEDFAKCFKLEVAEVC